jgi:hypothetical protein
MPIFPPFHGRRLVGGVFRRNMPQALDPVNAE